MKKRIVFPARLLAMYECNGWKAHMATVQRTPQERHAFQILTYSPDYRNLRREVAYTLEHAKQGFRDAKRRIAVEIAKEAMGIKTDTVKIINPPTFGDLE
jgi:septation ring formation regulator EzrA